jgi:hypothetical protein
MATQTTRAPTFLFMARAGAECTTEPRDPACHDRAKAKRWDRRLADKRIFI